MNLSVVSRNIGIVLVFNAFFMLLSALVSALYNFDSAFSPLLLSCFITLIAGMFPLVFVRKSDTLSAKEGYTIVIFSWLLSCIFGMLPYVLWGGEFSLINAWFESVSGYTTCGGTIVTDIESLPHGLLFWRSSTHFLGGLGVIVFVLLILPTVSGFRQRLSKVEISVLSKENYKFRTRQTISVMASVYLGLTIAETVALMLAGMNLFDAVNHAFSTISTGGFSTRNASIMAYDSVLIETIIIFFMTVSGLHFGLIYMLVVSRSLKIFKSPVTRYYLMLVFGLALLMTIDTRVSNVLPTWGDAFRCCIFQAVSVASSTGFATADTSVWPAVSIILLMFLTIHAACSGSTSGGVKADRFFIFFKSVKAQLKKSVHPNAVIPVRVGNQIVEPEIVSAVNLFIAFYIMLLVISSVILLAIGMPFMEAISSVIASMSNTGPGFGSVGSLGNFAMIPVVGKFILTFLMLLGRLEIFPVLVIFVIYKWR